MRYLDGVGHGERHVAIQHQRKVVTDFLAPPLEESHILSQALITSSGTVRTRDLGTHKAHLLGKVGAGGRAVHRQTVLGLASKQRVDGLVADQSKKIWG